MTEVIVEPAGVPRARAMLERAEWASRAYGRYDSASVTRIVNAVAEVAAAHAKQFAQAAVDETGFGVVEHKILKNIACSTGLVATYAGQDFVAPQVDADRKIVSIPRPAGVVLALTPSTNPVATVYFKTLLALMTRNAIVISPHPMAKVVCAQAARLLAEAAVAAGAPDGVIQYVEDPSVPLVTALMADSRTSVVVATGGTAMVRAAYRSGSPSLGVGPGNVPVLVDATADLAAAAKRIVDSKSFDNSILCTNESVLIAEDSIADQLMRNLQREGAHLLNTDETAKIRDTVFPGGHFDTAVVGKDAAWIASRAGIRVPSNTKVLLAPFDLVVPEEMLAHEKLCPVLGVVRVPSAALGIKAAAAVLRISGSGHSAAIHSTDPHTIIEFGSTLRVLRISVNVGNSLGSSGIQTNLAPSMTIGTGFVGGSSLTENLTPGHLVQWTKLAWNADAKEPLAAVQGLDAWTAPNGPVPAYPVASNAAGYASPIARAQAPIEAHSEMREEIRRMIIAELHDIVKRGS